MADSKKFLSYEGLQTLVTQINQKIKPKADAASAIGVNGNEVSLKLDNSGNVQFSQSATGLKGSVTIPAATVTGVKSGDKVLAMDGTSLTSTLNMKYENQHINLYGIDTKTPIASIDAADFIKDGMLDNASFNEDTKEITLTFNTASGKDPIVINVSSLVDTYTAAEDGGLTLKDHAFSVDTTKIATAESVTNVSTAVSKLAGAAVQSADAAAASNYVQATVSKSGTKLTVGANATIQAIATASASTEAPKKGLAEASDVKTYVDTAKQAAIDAAKSASSTDAASKIDTAIKALNATVTSDDTAVATVKVVESAGKITDVQVTNVAAGVAYTAKTASAAANLAATTATGAVTGADIAQIKSYVDAVSAADGSATDTKITKAINELDSTASGTGGFSKVTVTQADGKITNVTVDDTAVAISAEEIQKLIDGETA